MSALIPGEVITQEGEIMLNEGRAGRTVRVTNSADRPIQVGSHFHFFEVNRALRFDRSEAYGCRLDIPAGTAVRFEPGEEREVTLVPLGGWHVVFGMNGLVNGTLDGEGAREAALDRARQQGFVDDEPQDRP